MVHIMEIGFFQLELLMLNELMAREDETRNSPLFELRCQNDQIKVGSSGIYILSITVRMNSSTLHFPY